MDCLRAQVGSVAAGVAMSTSDRDEVAVRVEAPEEVFGRLSPSLHTKRERDGDIDLTIYSLRQFAVGVERGWVNAVEALFADDNMVLSATDVGNDLRRGRAQFLSRQMIYGLNGAANGAMKRAQHKPRQQEVERYGYDAKAYFHAFRHMVQAEELLAHGTFTVGVPDMLRDFAHDLRSGQFSEADVKNAVSARFAIVDRVSKRSDLPERADSKALGRWIERLHRQQWEQWGL